MGGVENLLPGIKMYYLATVTETFWYWYRKKSMEKNRVQIQTQIPLAIQDRIQMTLYGDGKRRNYSIDWAGISIQPWWGGVLSPHALTKNVKTKTRKVGN